MSDLGTEICSILKATPQGMSAKDLATRLNTQRSVINKYLYAHPEEYLKDDSYVPLWHLKGNSTELDPVMQKLQNRDNAKRFSQTEFDCLANWRYGNAFIGNHHYKTRKGNIIECDSQSEVLMLSYLEEKDLVLDLGGQILRIGYDSAFRTELDYYPDIVALTVDHHIAIIEVKPVTAMDNHKNMEKYRALEAYCRERGFMFMMIDPQHDFMTYEEMRDMDVCGPLLDMFIELNEMPVPEDCYCKFFDDDKVDKWYELFGNGYTKTDFKLQVHSLVAYYGWYNLYKNGFMVYSKPIQFKNK